MRAPCSIDGCEVESRGRGWCMKHWKRWRKHGDPLYVRPRFSDPNPRFDSYCQEEGECLVWKKGRHSEGYGLFTFENRSVYAHRYVYERENGPVPDGMFVDHICHNRACVLPEHLRLATPAQNAYNRSGSTRGRRVDLPRNVYLTPSGRYVVIIRKGRRGYNFGTYDTPEEASAVAERKRQELFGDHAGEG